MTEKRGGGNDEKRGLGAALGEIAAAGRGNDGGGGGGSWGPALVLLTSRLPRRGAAMTEVGAAGLGDRRWCCSRRDTRGKARV